MAQIGGRARHDRSGRVSQTEVDQEEQEEVEEEEEDTVISSAGEENPLLMIALPTKSVKVGTNQCWYNQWGS